MLDYSEREICVELKRTLSSHRYEHTLGVAETAELLASRFGEDTGKARLAGLMHDCAKGMSVPDMLALIDQSGMADVDDDERSMPALLHAPAGAALAREKYHITGQDILAAIRWHTTGHVPMTRLEKIIYLADMIEPHRNVFDGLDAIRNAAETDLDKAVIMAAQCSVNYVMQNGGHLHPRTAQVAQLTVERK